LVSVTPSAPTHVAPIRCEKCGQPAHIVRRAPNALKRDGKSEIRTFECEACGHHQSITVDA